MIAAVLGFLGSIVGLVATGIAAVAGLAFFVIAWKSGSLPGMVDWVTAFISGGWGAVMEVLAILRQLITFAGS